MPKCSKCGKKFSSISALQDHYKAVHPSQRFVAPKVSASRNFTVILIIGIIAVASIAGYLVYSQLTQTNSTSYAPYIGTFIPQSLMNNLTGVSYATLNSVGAGSGVTPPSRISGVPLVSGNKPLIVYIGGEFCPYCAVERWGLIVALAKFGNFTGLQYMASSGSDVYPNTPTFTFHFATYSSPYIAFKPIEEYDRSHNPLQTPLSNETALINTYDSSGGIPFVDIGNQFAVAGSTQVSPSILSGLNWTQVASQLNNPSSSIAKGIDGEANTLISVFCKVDGDKPSSLCSQSFARLISASPSSAGIIQLPLEISSLLVKKESPATKIATLSYR